MDKTLYLVLENGKVFKGYSIGAEGEAVGETVFHTAALGYNETIGDPAFCGQIVVQTFPLVGNYGIIEEEIDSKKPSLAGYIVKSICDEPSNFRCAGTLNDFLKANGIVGLAGIDTRELTKILRDNGTMNGKITSDISNVDSIVNSLKSMQNDTCPCKVSAKEIKTYKTDDAAKDICLLDLGATDAFINIFTSLGYNVTVVPYDTKAEEILNQNPDGVVISQGPGAPDNLSFITDEIKKLIDKNIPIYACGLGHELVALALGAKVSKHKFGHRGANQPVKDTKSGKTYITSQNHGYIVEENSLPAEAYISFVNVNDRTVEGFDYKNIVTSQFVPNLCNGPHNTSHILGKFESIMKGDN